MGRLLRSAYYLFRLRWRFFHWDRMQIEKHQQKRLRALLALLKETSSFYSKYLPEELLLANVPVIDKKIFMENFDRINTIGLNRESVMQFSLSQQKKGDISLYHHIYSVGLSSGTSGNVTLTVLSQQEREKYPLLLLSRTNIRSYVRKPRVLFLLRRNNPAFMEVNNAGVVMIYSDYTATVGELISLINENNINVIAGPPSLLLMIGEDIQAIHQKPAVLYSYAEVLSGTARKKLERIYQCTVNEIYQGAEGFLAATCRAGKLHLNEDTTHFEFESIDPTNPKAQRVIVTDLYRTAVPFVRYSLHDILEIDNAPCACGSRFTVVQKIHGREDDIFTLQSPDGDMVYLFPDYVRRSINQASEDIQEYQAVHKKNGDILIRLVITNNGDTNSIEASIRENLFFWIDKIGGMHPNIRFVYEDPVRNANSHKLIRVINET